MYMYILKKCTSVYLKFLMSIDGYIILPKMKTEVPIIIAWPTPPTSSAKTAAKHPNPPPSMVPIPRFKPLLSVAPIYIYICVQ